MEAQLASVLAQLDALTGQVRTLAAASAAAAAASAATSSSAAPPPPPPPLPPLTTHGAAAGARQISQSMLLPDRSGDVLRPTLYRHRPEARLDGLEGAGFGEDAVLATLKLGALRIAAFVG